LSAGGAASADKMRLVFMGTPEFSARTLAALVEAGHDIAAVYTRAPKPAGRRGLDLTKSPVHAFAEARGLAVHAPASLRDAAAAETFASHRADAAIVVAYGLLLPRQILDAPRLYCLNLHASLLPRWRGAAPIQRAIMAGDAETGVMVMRMEEGLDTGPVAATRRLAIDPGTTAGDAHDRLASLGAALLVETLAGVPLAFTPQPAEGVTYAKKVDKAETRIDWSLDATAVRNQIHGLSPFPGAWCEADFGKGPERLKILRACLESGAGAPGVALDDALAIACGQGALRLLGLQRAGKPAMAAADFLRGQRVPRGARLS